MVWKKLNLTQQKHAFANQNKCNSTQNKHKKLKLDLVAFYDIWPVNGAGLFSKDKISQGGDKQGKSEEKRTSGKAYDINNIYIALKSNIALKAHYALEPARGRSVETERWKKRDGQTDTPDLCTLDR